MLLNANTAHVRVWCSQNQAEIVPKLSGLCQTAQMRTENQAESTRLTPRAQARVRTIAEILRVARAHLAVHSAPGLSLRAIARDLDMGSSAIYRYVASRDELLTLLIVRAYEELGEFTSEAFDAAPDGDAQAKLLAVAHSLRSWAHKHPNDYALIFGTPVPGYAAPQDTISPAQIVPSLLVRSFAEHGEPDRTLTNAEPMTDAIAAGFDPVRPFFGSDADPRLVSRGIALWCALLGLVSAELFGHLHNVVMAEPQARADIFGYQIGRAHV